MSQRGDEGLGASDRAGVPELERAADPQPPPTGRADTGAPAGPRAPRVPAAALSERNALARAKGLPGLLIQGGEDPTPELTRKAEGRYVRLLVLMVAAIVLAGFVLGFAGLIVGGPAPS